MWFSAALLVHANGRWVEARETKRIRKSVAATVHLLRTVFKRGMPPLQLVVTHPLVAETYPRGPVEHLARTSRSPSLPRGRCPHTVAWRMPTWPCFFTDSSKPDYTSKTDFFPIPTRTRFCDSFRLSRISLAWIFILILQSVGSTSRTIRKLLRGRT